LLPYYTQVSAIAQRYISSVLAGRLSPGNALSAAQREIDALQRRYEMK